MTLLKDSLARRRSVPYELEIKKAATEWLFVHLIKEGNGASTVPEFDYCLATGQLCHNISSMRVGPRRIQERDVRRREEEGLTLDSCTA
jgi:hypothetical protein